MTTLDKIVERSISQTFGVKHHLLKTNGFMYSFVVLYDISNPKRDYASLEAKTIGIIFDELVLNAIKAIYSVEEPYLASNRDKLKKRSGKIEVRVYEEQDKYGLSCKDNGCGISKKNKPLVFNNGVSTWSRAGLGLGRIRRHVTTLDGNIYFESKLHKGTTFYVELLK